MMGRSEISEGTDSEGPGFDRFEGIQVIDTYEASDPRLSGEMTKTANAHLYEPMTGTFVIWASSLVLVNEAGRWVGTADAFRANFPPDQAVAMTLHGEGAYEGLTAYLIEDCRPDPCTFAGVIVPDEMPQAPELPA